MANLKALSMSGVTASSWIRTNMLRRPSLPFSLANAVLLGLAIRAIAGVTLLGGGFRHEGDGTFFFIVSMVFIVEFGLINAFPLKSGLNLNGCDLLNGIVLLPSSIACLVIEGTPFAILAALGVALAASPIIGIYLLQKAAGDGIDVWIASICLAAAIAAWKCRQTLKKDDSNPSDPAPSAE